VPSRSAELESAFLCSFALGEEGDEDGEEGGISSGSDVCAGLAILILELDLEGIFVELDRRRIFL
jgi:hypothetical protein